MLNQPLPAGFLAIHPPRRLWPSVPVFYSQNLPALTQQAKHAQPHLAAGR